MTDHTDDRLDELFEHMKGNCSNDDHDCVYDMGEETFRIGETKQAIRQLIREEQEALLNRVLATKSEAHSMSRSVGSTVYIIMPTDVEAELAALRQEKP